jgi:DNA repair protein RadC
MRESVESSAVCLADGLDDVSKRCADEVLVFLAGAGARAMTDQSLLTVLGVSAVEAEVGLSLTQGLVHVAEAPELAFEVAPLLTTRVLAALELTRRLSERRQARPKLMTPQAIARWAREALFQHRREEVWVVSLNARNAVLRRDCVGIGGVDHCVVDPREVLAPAVACRATAVVLVHSHPSGDPEPSTSDVALTRRLRDAARTLQIALLDHVVVADRSYVSMLERGLLESGRRHRHPVQSKVNDEDD